MPLKKKDLARVFFGTEINSLSNLKRVIQFISFSPVSPRTEAPVWNIMYSHRNMKLAKSHSNWMKGLGVIRSHKV